MKETDPEKHGSSGATDDGPADVDLDVGDVDLAPQSGHELPPVAPRRTAPPPLPPSALSQPPVSPSYAPSPSQAPPPPSMAPSILHPPSRAPEPPPRSKLVYGVVLVGFFVVCLAAGAVYVRASSPKVAPAASATATTAPTASAAQPSPSGSGTVAPKVITINPVDMGGNEAP